MKRITVLEIYFVNLHKQVDLNRKTISVLLILLALFSAGCKQAKEPKQEASPPWMAPAPERPLPKELQWAEPYLTEYSKIPMKRNLQNSNVYIKGKLLPIDVTDPKSPRIAFDDRDSYEPLSKFFATKPEEVGTIILIKKKEVFAGNYHGSDSRQHYSGRREVYKEDWVITIIDKSRGLIVVRKTFHGPEPPHEIMVFHGSIPTYSPMDEVIDYILKLPRI